MKINQVIKEYETPALDAVDANETYAPPSKGFAIRVHGPLGGAQQVGTPAATLWYGLTAVFPRDYPPAAFQSIGQQMASPQARVLNTIRREGSAVVKSGITTRDMAETLANKLASYGPHPSEPGAGRIPMSQIEVISQDLDEGTAGLPDPQNFDSDNDYYNALDAYGNPPADDYEPMGSEGEPSDDWFDESRDKVGNMDADAFDAALARMKKLAGAGPLKTVYDPAKRVYKNVPHAVQPAQQPKKAPR
jgi:hypothetical protein